MKVRVFSYAAIVVFGLVATAFAFSVPAAAYAGPLSGMYAGNPALTNANCNSNCIKYFRHDNKLQLVVLDENGKIFTVRTVTLPRNAKLTSRARGTSAVGNVQPRAGGGTITSDATTVNYTSTNGGVTTVTVVTTTFTYLDGNLVDVDVTVTQFTLSQK